MNSQNSNEMEKAHWEAVVLRDALHRNQINISTSLALDIVARMHDKVSWEAWADAEDARREPFRRFHEKISELLQHDPKWR